MLRSPFLLAFALLAGVVGAADVESFSPQGAVSNVRQAKARFSAPMVKFGDPRLPAPMDVECGGQEGAGRWLDDRTWVYDFKQDLPAAVNCEFRVKSGLRAQDGTLLPMRRLSFTTGGPEPRQIWPDSYQQLTEDQVFVVSFAVAPTPESLSPRLKCVVEGIAERIPAYVLPANERERYYEAIFGRDRKNWPANLLAFRCQRPLPNETGLKVVFDAGLSAANGASTRAPMEYDFRVRPRFSAAMVCERLRAKSACMPITPIRVRFTSPVSWAQASQISLATLDGKQRWLPEPQLENENEYATEDSPADAGNAVAGKPARDSQLVIGVRFKPAFPELGVVKLLMPAGLRDESGRPLSNAAEFPQTIKIDNYPPLAKFAADFGIIERAVGVLPVTVRNVGQQAPKEDSNLVGKLLDVFKAPADTQAKLAPKQPVALTPSTDPRLAAQALQAQAPRPAGLGLPYRQLTLSSDADIMLWYERLRRGPTAQGEMDARGTSQLKTAPGVQTLRLPTPNDDRAAEVIGIPLTRPGLHIVEIESHRLGARLMEPPLPMFVASGALVTNLSVHYRRGLDDALVWVTTLDKGWLVNNASVAIYDCKAKLLVSGKTDSHGLWRTSAALPAERYDCPQYVFARTGDDVSFTASSWRDGIESWRYGLPTEREGDRRSAYAAVLDRGLYRAGDTVAMKLIARERTADGFGAVRADSLPNRVRLSHQGSDESVTLPLTWQGGAALASWKVPKEAKLGAYAIEVERVLAKKGKVEAEGDKLRRDVAGELTVGEFRVPLMKATLKLPVKPVAVESLEASVQLQYLAGGPAAGEKVKLRGLARPAGSRSLEDFEEFSFASGNVDADVLKGGKVAEQGESGESRDKLLETRETLLDKAGSATLALTGWERLDAPMLVSAELEFTDPNGEIQTAAAVTTVYPANVLAGLKVGESKSDGVALEAGIASLDGKPLAGRSARIEGWLRQTFSHRKRLVGGFYSYENETVYKALGEICKGTTDARGRFACRFKSTERGDIVLRVTTVDEAGRPSYTKAEVYAWGEGESWWEQKDGDRIDLVADRKRYEPGSVASIQVRMPFQEATALVAVEREKVLEVQTVNLTASNPVIRVPIKASYGPNVYVSVLAVRGRVADPAATALVDLGKPAYKLGIIKLNVGGRGYALDVKVAADKAVYDTRAHAQVKIAVKTPDGKPLPKGAEVAVAAVDEGLLQLRANTSWDLLKNMLGERPYGFYTATAQGQVIGKRHFGRKAVPVGGGGGRSSTRELFDTLLKWQPRVVLDANGEATIDVPLNDALTSFRIVAVATAGNDRFGTGQTSIRASKDVMLFAGLANTVRQEDRFEATFTVRNTTQEPVKLTVTAKADGLPPLDPQALELAAGAARELSWPVAVPASAQQIAWTVEVAGEGGRMFDRLAVKQKVIEAVPVVTLQATLAQVPPDYTLSVERPKDALPGRGGVTVQLTPSLADALGGVERYFRDYPYSCLEQQTSIAIGLNDTARWKDTTARLSAYLDAEGFAKYWPNLAFGSVDLTTYLLSISHDAGFALPEGPLERMKTALAAYVAGRTAMRETIPGDATWRAQRKLRAIAALARYDAARPGQLDGLVIEPNRWPTGTLLDWIYLLESVHDIPRQVDLLKEARQILAARLDISGTTLNFSTEKDDYWWWMMDTPDANASRVLLDAIAHEADRGDLGRMARGVVARQQRGHWNTTLANAWGAVALRRFAAKVESGKPSGSTTVKLGDMQSLDWAGKPKGATLQFDWPASAANLAISHQGAGKPWAMIASRAALPLSAPLSSGYTVQKQWTAVEAKDKAYRRGDVWRVRLTIDAQADMSWVAVNDPLPAGASLLGKGLGNESAILTRKEEGGWLPSFVERGETRYTAYFEWLPKGRHVVEYTVRLNGRGDFRLPPTRVEAMYAPERFGELPNALFKVE